MFFIFKNIKYDYIIRKGDNCFKDNDFLNALKYYNEYLDFRYDSKVLFKKSEVLFYLNRFEESLELLESIFNEFKSSKNYLFLMCDVLQALNKFSDSVFICDLAISSGFDDLVFYQYKSHSLIMLHNYEDALDVCENFLKGSDFNFYIIMESYCYLQLGDYEIALDYIDKFINNFQNCDDEVGFLAFSLKVDILIKLNRIDESNSLCDYALAKCDYSNSYLLYLKSKILFKLEKYEESLLFINESYNNLNNFKYFNLEVDIIEFRDMLLDYFN